MSRQPPLRCRIPVSDWACPSSTQIEQLDNFQRAFGKRLHECATIGFGHDAIVEDDNDFAVGLGSD
jgi:hypothetical protein